MSDQTPKPEPWHTTVWDWSKHPDFRFQAGSRLLFDLDFLTEILPDATYATLFTYMFRRFGVPTQGSDGYKDIAYWLLSTPDERFVLWVKPNPSAADTTFCFGYGVPGPLTWDTSAQADLIAALSATARDLLAPTYVRDVYINACGIVNDCEVDWDNDPSVPYAKWAGYAVPESFFEAEYPDGP